MWGLLARVLKRAGAKTLLVAASIALTVLAVALWMTAHRALEIEAARVERVAGARQALASLEPLIGEASRLAEETGAELERQRRRLELAESLAENTAALHSWWQRLWLSAEERARIDRREELAKRTREEAGALAAETQRRLDAALARLGELSASRDAALDELARLEASADPFMQALREAWERVRPWALGAAAGILFGPLLWKLFCYHLWAPWVEQDRPPAGEPPPALPAIRHAGPSVDIRLAPGETLLVRPACARSSDERLARGHRWLLDWRHPFSSMAAGLYGLYGYTARDAGASVTVVPGQGSGWDDCVEIAVPEGVRVALRPGRLAGMVPDPRTHRPRVRARWLLGSRAAWLALQFRVLEYSGPCRLVVCGARGLRGIPTDGFGQRARPGSVVARTSGLAWGLRRAETFWGYAWAGEPLFDELYRGRGWMLTQDGEDAAARRSSRWWNGLADTVLRIFGL